MTDFWTQNYVEGLRRSGPAFHGTVLNWDRVGGQWEQIIIRQGWMYFPERMICAAKCPVKGCRIEYEDPHEPMMPEEGYRDMAMTFFDHVRQCGPIEREENIELGAE